MTLTEFVERALSVPFIDHGRDYAGWDCWGLLCCAYRDVHGIALPLYAAGYADSGRTAAGVAAIATLYAEMVGRDGFWQAQERPAPGEAVALRLKGRPIHVGLLIDSQRFVHAVDRSGTCIEQLSSPLWRNRIEGYYRYAR